MEYDLSIIMPVHNNGKKILSVIEDIYYKNDFSFNLIVIDDGSDDDTYEVIRAMNYKNLQVYKIKNSGPGAARFFGISKSTSKYVTFIDSDDFYSEKGFLEEALNYAINNNLDLLITGYNKIHKNKNTYVSFKDNVKETKKLINDKIFYPVWNKIYKLSIIRDNNITMYDIFTGEDYCFNLDYMEYVDKIDYIDKSLIDYGIHNNSITSKYHENIFEIRELILNKKRNFLIKKEIFNHDDYYNEYLRIIAKSIFHQFNKNSKNHKFKDKKRYVLDLLNQENYKINIKTKFKKTNFVNYILWILLKLKMINVLLILFSILKIFYRRR